MKLKEKGKIAYSFQGRIIKGLLLLFDICAVNGAYLAALLLRFDLDFHSIPVHYLQIWRSMIPIHTVFALLMFWKLKLYKSLWNYVSISEMVSIFWSTALSGAFQIVLTLSLFGRMPISYYIIGWLFEFSLVMGVRYGYRVLRIFKMRNRQFLGQDLERVMVIGAGEAGRLLIKELENSEHLHAKVCCIIDDDRHKQGRLLDGIPIVGTREDILEQSEAYKIEKIIFAIPTASAKERGVILNICKETCCELQVLPGIYQLVKGEVSVSSLRKVSVEELLGREAIRVNLDEIMGYVKDRTVMVTGGGGSIGSELCRQIAVYKPGRLIIFELYENSAYDIEQELRMTCPDLAFKVIIGSVRDTKRMDQVFECYRPDIVYHAAAHKHVPLMEDSPNEAIKNNVFGTYKTALAASKYGVSRFVLISTDKAVNPTNIMGASKRLCEMIVQNFNRKSDTEFVAVRFGNVLGSNGSVIPLFQRQIAAGGPVTVTHPDIVRYFMTIPEAVSLVLQAGVYAKGGEIFVLDMGEPVKIDDLAKNLIKLSGYKPDVDIAISYTGLRPGEKLYEELLISEEGLQKTKNGLIYIGKPIDMDYESFEDKLKALKVAAENNTPDIREKVKELVDTYMPEKTCVMPPQTEGRQVEKQRRADKLLVRENNQVAYSEEISLELDGLSDVFAS